MGHVELVGKQANGRDTMLRFDSNDYPKTTEEWIVRAEKAGANFDAEVTKEAGITLGQFMFGGGFVKVDDSLENYVDARNLIDEITKNTGLSDINTVDMVLIYTKAKLGIKEVSDFRKVITNKVDIQGPYSTRDEILEEENSHLPTDVLNAVDWSKVGDPAGILTVKIPSGSWWKITGIK